MIYLVVHVDDFAVVFSMTSNFNDADQDNSPTEDIKIFIIIIKTRPGVASAVNKVATRARAVSTKNDYHALLEL
jgi:hypothetical protein